MNGIYYLMIKNKTMKTITKESEILTSLLELYKTVDKDLEPELARSVREAIFTTIALKN
tara:strand:+ start:4198 stop:4374 length:177 start_codon:yes stop_codon:yes gene_type:complete